MSDYTKVQEALASGASPVMLCTTCPWDRFCITPPSMTKADIDRQIAEASAKDEVLAREAKAAGKEAGMPMGMLMTALVVGGRDTQASICPVLALRLRSSHGREIEDQTKSAMQSWDDDR